MNRYLYVRLCDSCCDEQIVEFPLFNELFVFLLKSIAIKEPRPGFVYVLQNKFLKIKDAAKENPTDDSFADWQTQRVAEIKARQEVRYASHPGLREHKVIHLGNMVNHWKTIWI